MKKATLMGCLFRMFFHALPRVHQTYCISVCGGIHTYNPYPLLLCVHTYRTLLHPRQLCQSMQNLLRQHQPPIRQQPTGYNQTSSTFSSPPVKYENLRRTHENALKIFGLPLHNIICYLNSANDFRYAKIDLLEYPC